MDRNTIIGLVLIAGIVFTWTIFFAPSNDEEQQKKAATEAFIKADSNNRTIVDSANAADSAKVPTPAGMADSVFNALSDSAKQVAIAADLQTKKGPFGAFSTGEDKVVEVETDKLKLTLHSKGGVLGGLFLKTYMTADSHMLPIQLESPNNGFNLQFTQAGAYNFPIVNTQDIYFSTSSSEPKLTVTGEATKELVFSAKLDDNRWLEYVYTFKGNTFDYGFEIRQKGLNSLIDRGSVAGSWRQEIPKTEKTLELMWPKTFVYYRESGSVDYLNDDMLEVPNADWIAFKSQFFTHTMMTASDSSRINNIKLAQMQPAANDDDVNAGTVVKRFEARFDIEIATTAYGSEKFRFVAAPLQFSTMKSYDRDMIKQIGLGWGPLQYINRFLVIPVFDFLQKYIGSYGLIIFILAVIIKLIIYPLTYRTYLSTAKMRIVNGTPEVKALEAKFKDEPTKLQQEKMKIYKQLGVSMFGGCWPMLLQYPFLVALFFFFPNAIELRQQSFWWAPDDSILDLGFNIPMYGNHVSLFTLLMTVSIFLYTIVNQRMQPQMSNNPVMKYFPYIMPVILLGFLNNYSAGLSWYYLISNVLSISQTYITRRFVNEEKLLAKMRETAKARSAEPGKGGTLERWAQRQQERQKQIAQQRAAGGGGGSGGGGSKGNSGGGKKRK
jgi:YidC/Oxa1 family membrane protein insertase